MTMAIIMYHNVNVIKLNYHIEDTNVSASFTKHNAEKQYAYLKRYLFLKYYFASWQNNPNLGI